MDVSSLFLDLPGVALHAKADAAPPEWIQLLPPGTFSGTDGRGPYHIADADALIRVSMAAGKLPIDENHSTDLAAPLGRESPARGWIVALENRGDDVRTGGIWGRVDWTQSGAVLMADKSYRGISPVFTHAKGGRVTKLLRAALTNTPNLTQLASLHARISAEERAKLPEEMFAVPGKRQLIIRDPEHVELAWDMVDRTADLTDAERAEARRRILARARKLGMDTSGWKAAAHSEGADMDIATVRKALGLPDTADEAACLAAMETGRQQVTLQAQQLAERDKRIADFGAKFVPLEEHVALQAQVDTMVKAASADAARRFVDQAIADGKPIAAESVRERMIALHMADPAATEKMVGEMPSINARGADGRFAPAKGGDGGTEMMSAEDKEVMSKFGLTKEQLAAWRKKRAEREEA
jgi:phage I-like protein